MELLVVQIHNHSKRDEDSLETGIFLIRVVVSGVISIAIIVVVLK